MPGELLIHYGNPGAGKTLFAMKEVVLPCVQHNRPFFTNITGISVSALSALTNVHQAFIKYYPVSDIHDVIRYFDDESISHDGVFVLDEMKDFIDDEKSISWLESRINVMRKHSVDFVLIAQQPAKEYIHPNIVKLANACNVYRTRKREGDLNRVFKYYVNGGVPKIIDNDVSNAVGREIVRKPVEMYNCFKTSESAFYTGAENDTYFGLKWWQERKWKLRFAAVGIAVVCFFGFVMLLRTFYDFGNSTQMSSTVKKLSQEVGNEKEHQHIVDRIDGPANTTPSCYTWKMCSEGRCETDIGTFPAYSDIDGRLCIGHSCYRPCTTGDGLPGRGGLLFPGGSLSQGTQPGLHSKR